MTKEVPNSTKTASMYAAAKCGVSTRKTREIIDTFIDCIRKALEHEVPFSITRLGKFYHSYRRPGRLTPSMRRSPDVKLSHDGKVVKTVSFKLTEDASQDLNGWVHDLGIPNNRNSELLKAQIKPDEIEKIRRRKTLEEQRSLGFRSDLLFDDPPNSDKMIEKDIGPAPTIEEIAKRIGINLGE